MTFNKVIQKVQTELPKDYYIEIFVEKGYGDIRVVDPDGNPLDLVDLSEDTTEEELVLILLRTAQEHSKTFTPRETVVMTLDEAEKKYKSKEN